MKYLFAMLFAVPVFLLADSGFGQEAGGTPISAAQRRAATTITQLRSLLKEKKLDEATELIERAIAQDSDNATLHDSRRSLASALNRNRQYDAAFSQVEKYLVYQIENPTALSPHFIASMTSRMQSYARLAKKGDRAGELVDQAFVAIETSSRSNAELYAKAMAIIVPIKAARMKGKVDTDTIHDFVKAQRRTVEQLVAEDPESTVTAIGKLHLADVGIPGASDEDQAALDAFLIGMREEHSESDKLMTDYVRLELSAIREVYLSNPLLARSRIDRLKIAVGEIQLSERRRASYERELQSYESKLAEAPKRSMLIGQPAPKLDIAAWVNQGQTTTKTLRGKVVLLDFWAVWCRPCIASFPHLRQWRSEFGGQGLEIVGVTKFDNYVWDDASKSAMRSDRNVPEQTEREALRKFMEHHNLKHPTIVTADDSTMQQEFNVTSIPHIVLIDRQGKVREMFIGSGAATTNAIHRQLVKLIAE